MREFNKLLEKRKNLTATIFEEEKLIKISKSLTKEQLKDVDETLLTYSNSDRLDLLNSKLDEFLKTSKYMRKSGYYWIKLTGKQGWEVAFYDENGWYSIWDGGTYNDDEVHTINETKLISPEDKINNN